MRMSRYLPLCLMALLPLASCDPFDLVEPRPMHGNPRYRPAPQPEPQPEPGPGLQPEPDNRPVPDRYPTAERTANPNQVLSPYPPYNVIDVTGFNPGQLARDPSNDRIFRIP